MKYIFMVAGKGTRLHPLTLKAPKCMFRLDKQTTVLQRMIRLIRKYDDCAEVIVVSGYMHDIIEKSVEDVNFIFNPFYEVTNSIASLWFAREWLLEGDVVLLDGDIVYSEEAVKEVICKKTEKPLVMIDSSVKNDGDYNVEISDGKILVMSKNLKRYYAEYAGITKLDASTAVKMYHEITEMVEQGHYDQWYEDALVQMIFNDDIDLYYEDVCNYKWTEIDEVDDLILAKSIQLQEG